MSQEVENPKKTEASEESSEVKPTAAPRKKRGKREVPHAIAHILSSFNNTIITFADPKGNTICWSSSGKRGFKGARKSTPFAAQVAAEEAARTAADQYGTRSVAIYVNGPGAGRETALRGIQSAGMRITYLRDITPIPHNGCRPPKRRRV